MNSPNPPRANALSHSYREGAWPEPNRQIEQAIRATERERRTFARRWALPVALAAAAVVTTALVYKELRQKPESIAKPPPVSGEAKSRESPAAAAEVPKPAEPKGPASAPGPATPTPSYAIRMDEAERRGLLHPEVSLKPGAPARESPPPPAPKAALKKDPPERAPAEGPTFLPSRPPQAWIEDIRKQKAEGKAEEAARALAEFRKRNPDYVLPEDLR